MTDAELDALTAGLRMMLEGYSEASIYDDYHKILRDGISAIATLRAQLADAQAEITRLTDLNSTAYIDGHDAAKNEYRDEIQRLEVLNAQLTVMVGEDAVEQIEAAVAAQIEADAEIAAAETAMPPQHNIKDQWRSNIGDDVAAAIRAQPHDRTALDAAIRAAKVEAWKEAAVVAANACLVDPDGGSPTEEERLVCDEAYRRILALIERDGV